MRIVWSKIFGFAALACACTLYAAEPTSNAAKAGMDPERLARITARMKEFVEKGTIPGAVMLMARHGVVAYLEAVGYQDLESKKPMRTDTIFATRSMQKSITAVGIMILVEEGRLTLADPVEKHLPEFRDQVVIDKRDGDKVLRTKKPSRPITIRDLLSHTSGVAGAPYREPLKSWIEEFIWKRDKTIAEVVALYAREPLEFEPGTRYLYSDLGFSILARIIEVASGQAYQDFLEQRILRPSGMRDTFYFVPPEKDGRIASAYRLENGQLTKIALSGQPDTKIDPFSAPAPLYRRGTKLVSGAGGWFSTATDMFAFYQMMLNGGTYSGRRILSQASVELMTQIHTDVGRTPPLPTANPANSPRPGLGYGLGWFVRGELAAPPELLLSSAGTYLHGGYLGTFGWVDPQRDLVGIFMMHRRPFSPSPERAAFIAMAAAAVVDDEKSKPNKNDAGMDSARLAGIPTRMKEFVEKRTIAGAVTLVARHGVVAQLEAVGYQDLESKKPMRADTIFNIASMTKSLTAVGIMILVEEGRLGLGGPRLGDPVEKYLPEFRDQMMVERREGDKVVATKKPSRPITILDLLTHTSGMPGARTSARQRELSLAEIVPQVPLEFEPGTEFLYSNWGYDMLGRIVEVVSDQRFDKFLEQHILGPLGMKDTFYFATPDKVDRFASGYDLVGGKLNKVKADPYRTGTKRASSSGGWRSTASDMFAFYQMMLNGGTFKGARILSRASVDVMTALHTGDLQLWFTPLEPSSVRVPGGPHYAGVGWGLGWTVVREPLGALRLQSIGSYGHGGSLGTYGWVDPRKDLVGLFLIQRTIEGRPGHGPERAVFTAMANAAIVH